MRRIAFGVLVIVLAGCGLSACGDDDGDNDDARPESEEVGAPEFETFCAGVVEYAAATLPAGAATEDPAAFDSLQALVDVVQEDIGAVNRDEDSLDVLRGCVDGLTNVLELAAEASGT